MNHWEDLEAPQNVCIASIPTVFNAGLAPPDKAVVHAYTAGNEPYSLWEGLDRRSQEYKKLKASVYLVPQKHYSTATPAISSSMRLIMDRTIFSLLQHLCCLHHTKYSEPAEEISGNGPRVS